METRESFSIREYVSRMRSVNVVKCWPFDETTSEESVKSLLPPITVRKFTWWVDVLDYLRSESSKNVDNSKKKKKKKKKFQEKAESSFRSENDFEESDADERMEVKKVKSSRAKGKAPKKRSMTAIFAVAPPVEMVNSGADDDEDDNGVQEEDGFCIGSKLSCNDEINWGLKGKRNEKKKMTKDKEIMASKLKKAKNVMEKIKNKKKKGDVKTDFSLPNEVGCYLFKLQDQDKGIKNQNSTYTRENESETRDCVSIRKKKPRLQHLDADKKKAGKACRLIARKRHQGNLKRDVSKNRTKEFSLQQSEKCLLQEAVQANHFGKQKADKHVKCLQKDTTNRKPSHTVERFKLEKHYGSDMHNIHNDSNVGKDLAIAETGSEDVSNRKVNEVDARPASEKQLNVPCCMVDPTTSMKQHNKEEHYSRFVTSSRTVDDKNKNLFDTCLREASHDPKYSCPPNSFCVSHEAYDNSRNTREIANSSSFIGGRPDGNFKTPGFTFPPVCFRDYLKTYDEPSVSCLSNLGKGANRMPQAGTAMNDARTVQYETFPHLSFREFQETACSEPHWYQTGNVCGMKSINGINEDFIGLPLNSEGEFIMLSSSANGDFNQTIESSNTAAAPPITISLPDNTLSNCSGKHSAHTSWDCRTSSRKQLNLFPVEDFLEDNPVVFAPSRSDITESRGNGHRGPDLDLIKISNHSLHSENFLCNEDIRVTQGHGNERILPKMRLMGKEFIVGRESDQGFGDEHIWQDKQMTDEFHLSNTSISNVKMHDQNEPSIGKLKEAVFVSSETNNQRSSSMYTFPSFDWRNSSMHQKGLVARKINAAEEVYHGLPPGCGIYNSKPLYLEPFPSGCDYWVSNIGLSTFPAANQDSCPGVSTSDIQQKNNQNLPHAPRSSIRFPLMHPDLEGHAQSCSSQNPQASRSPWFFDVPGKKMLVNNFQSCHALGCRHHHGLHGDNWRPDSSVSINPEAFHLYKPFSFGSILQTSLGPSLMHPTLSTNQAPMLCHPGAKPISSAWRRHANEKKIREGIESRIGIRGHGHGRRAKRQPLAVSSVSFKPVWLPSLEFNESSRCDIAKSTTCVNFEGAQNVETVESRSATKKIRNSDL